MALFIPKDEHLQEFEPYIQTRIKTAKLKNECMTLKYIETINVDRTSSI